jgi:hypothetical protein
VKDFRLHEDDWGMISLDPDESRVDRERVVAEAAAHGEAHRAPEGIGWTTMYVAPAPAIEIAVRALSIDALRAALGPDWHAYDRVLSGYSSSYEVVKHAFAFSCATCVVYGNTDGARVTHLCITRCVLEIADVLHRLGTTFRLVLTDLWRDSVVDLSDRDAIDRYIADTA